MNHIEKRCRAPICAPRTSSNTPKHCLKNRSANNARLQAGVTMVQSIELSSMHHILFGSQACLP